MGAWGCCPQPPRGGTERFKSGKTRPWGKRRAGGAGQEVRVLRAVSGRRRTPPSTAKHVMGRGKKKKKKTSFRKKRVLVLFPPLLEAPPARSSWSPQGPYKRPSPPPLEAGPVVGLSRGAALNKRQKFSAPFADITGKNDSPELLQG